MSQGVGWPFVAANIDGFNINPGNTAGELYIQVVAQGRRSPVWVMHENEVSAALYNSGQYFIDYYEASLGGIPHMVYGRFLVMDLDGGGRRFAPGVVSKWRNAQPFASVTTTVFGSGRGTEFSSCTEAFCEDNWSALRESDGFVYEQVPSFLNGAHGSRGGEWVGHREAWRTMYYLCRSFGKRIIWLMATTGGGSLPQAQESYMWMKSQGLVPDVIIVANYGTPGDPARGPYPSIPEGEGDNYPDTLTGIARWLLVNR